MSATEAARRLLVDAGHTDPPALLVEVVAALNGDEHRRRLIDAATPAQVQRMRLLETPRGRLVLVLADLVAEGLAELRGDRNPESEG